MVEPAPSGLKPARAPLPPAYEIGRFSTTFDTTQPSRTHNIVLAAGRLDGSVVMGGGRLDFNDVVGARSTENGFETAPVLFAGRVVDGVGGGVCQVASTLHASARFAKLEIVERRPHSRASKYVEPGLDATVAYPPEGERINLVVRNPTSEPVTLRSVVESDRLTMWWIGPASVPQPEYATRIGRYGAHERRWVRSWTRTSPTYRKRLQTHAPGLHVWSKLTFPDGSVDEWFSRYAPVDEVWEVGRRYDADAGAPWD